MDGMVGCKLCGKPFPRRKDKKGWDKRSLQAKLLEGKVTVHFALSEVYLYKGPSEGHVCGNCFSRICREYKAYITMPSPSLKRKILSDTSDTTDMHTPQKSHRREEDRWLPTHTPTHTLKFPYTPVDKKTRRKTASSITRAVKDSKYYAAIRQILLRGKAAQKAFMRVLSQKIKKEMKSFQKSDCFPEIDGIDSIKKFSWTTFVGDMRGQMPTLVGVLESAMPRVEEDKYRSWILPRLGFMLSLPLYSTNPKKYRFLQALYGVQMWRCGSSEKLFQCFNHLGICQSIKTIRRHVNRFCEEPDKVMMQWKQALEPYSDDCHTDQVTVSQATSSDPTPTATEPLPSTSTAVPIGEEFDVSSTIICENNTSKEQSCGYALVWDNTQLLVQDRDQSRSDKNQMRFLANAYGVKNRVDPKGLDDNDVHQNASHIPIQSYFHNSEDEEMLRLRMETIVSRILVNNIPHFKENYEDTVLWHIPHRHQDSSSKKSELVNIGVINANPSSTEGVIKVMESLQQYVPRRKDGTYRVVPAHGDALSVERMTEAKKARAAYLTDTDRLEGLEASPQEFHHRGLMLQETMNVLFSSRSIGERGTLAQLKNAFQHHHVTKDVMNSVKYVKYVDNFVRFATEAHVAYLAMKICGMENVTDFPCHSVPDGSKEERQDFLTYLSRKVVQEVWLLTSDLQAVFEAEVDGNDLDWCFCGEDKDEPMVQCSNSHCPHGAWFHISCVNVERKDMPGIGDDWWCSSDCKDTGVSTYCKCRKVRRGPVVMCARGENCTEGSVFHLDCVQLTQVPVVSWYCSQRCAKLGEEGEEPDHVRNYALALTWNGLLDLSHRDIIQEADGLALISMWRLNVPRLWGGNHYKYLITAHRLLAGVSGWLTPRLIEEVVHNRTVNLRGGKGENIAMDQVCEFLNADFKETLRHAPGQDTDETVKRAGRIGGALGEALDQVFEEVSQVSWGKGYRKRPNYVWDIHAFVEEYKVDKLFDHIPGRQHDSFPGFQCKVSINRPEKLKSRLLKYSKKLDHNIP